MYIFVVKFKSTIRLALQNMECQNFGVEMQLKYVSIMYILINPCPDLIMVKTSGVMSKAIGQVNYFNMINGMSVAPLVGFRVDTYKHQLDLV